MREAIGIIVVVGLAAGVVYQLRSIDAESAAPTPTVTASVATTAPAPTIAPDRVTRVTPRVPATSSPSTTATLPDPAEVDRVVADTQAALDAWARFATTGRIRELRGHFVVGGPQRVRLREEAEVIAADPPGGPAYVFVLVAPVVTFAGEVALVTADVSLSREGEPTQRFEWMIEMRLVDRHYELWTVTALS